MLIIGTLEDILNLLIHLPKWNGQHCLKTKRDICNEVH